MRDRTAGLSAAAQHALEFLSTLDERPVAASVDADGVRTVLGGPLPEHGEAPTAVIDALVAGADPGLVASAGPRHFGFVIGGALPAALAADWVVSAWDQNAAFHSLSPAAAAIEEVTSAWTLDLLGLPTKASVGFVTGGQGPTPHVWRPPATRYSRRPAGTSKTTDSSVHRQYASCAANMPTPRSTPPCDSLDSAPTLPVRVAADDQGRMNPAALQDALADADGPTIVCAQAGNVATGSFDAFEPIADACSAHDAWLHVDGAFGLWAAAAPATRHLTRGVERADSWAVDAHKWLNVPYDGAMAIVADPDTHVAAMGLAGPYLVADPGQRDNTNYVPESSRRARAVPVYAALRSLGRAGVAELIERNCAQARRMAERLATIPGAEVINDVVLNQVLLRLPGGDDVNRAAVSAIQRDGTCWLGGTTWNGHYMLRISISNWATTDDDVERSADAIVLAAQSLSPR